VIDITLLVRAISMITLTFVPETLLYTQYIYSIYDIGPNFVFQIYHLCVQ